MKKNQVPKWLDRLELLVRESNSYAEIIDKLHLSRSGSKYRTIKKWITALKLNTDHFSHKRRIENLRINQLTNDKIFVENSKCSSGTLRRRSLKEIVPYQCIVCKNTGVHNKRELTLQLDHINGIRNDNRKENLRWLCPNCHSQTETWGYREKTSTIKLINTCVVCSKSCKNKYCSRQCCSIDHKKRGIIGKSKIEWPPLNVLIEKLENSSYEQLGRELGVTGAAVKKHIKTRLK